MQVSPADFFAIMVLAFIAVTSVLGSSRVRGLASLGLGLTIGLIGIDTTSGQQRLTFGIPELADGIDVVVVAVGLFAVGEALWTAAHLRRSPVEVIPVGNPRMNRADWGRSWKPWLRGTAIGFPFGAIPAGGAEIPTFLSYVTEKRLSKHPEEFGNGAIEGVAGPEATNNASAAGGLVPLLTLGIPTTATAAVMLAAIQSYGIEPGPQLFSKEPELVWGLIASLFIGNTVLLVLNLPLAPLWARLLRIPRSYLYAGILFFSSLGAYAANASTFDLFLLLIIGALGFMMRRYGLPVLPGDHRGDPRPVRRGEAPPGAADQQRRRQRPVRADLDRRLLHRRADPAVAAGPPVPAPQGGAQRPRGGRARDRGGPPAHRADQRGVGGAARRRRGPHEARLRGTERSLTTAEGEGAGRPLPLRRSRDQASGDEHLQVAHVDAGAVAEAGHHGLQPTADGHRPVEQGAQPRHPHPLAGDGEHEDGGDERHAPRPSPRATGSPADSASRPIAGGPPSRPV